MYGINVEVRRDVLKNKDTVSLNMSDIFNTRQFNIEVNGETYNQEPSRKRESRIATLTFIYKFGKFQDNRKAEKRGRDRNEPKQEQQGGGEDFF
jgi:hypothetical protein